MHGIGQANWTDDSGTLAEKLVSQWRAVDSVEAFQERVVKPFLQGLMAQTTEGVTWDGPSISRRHVVPEQPPRHCLGSFLINVALLEEGRGSTEIGIGSNLLSRPWVNDLVRLNRCFVVERSGSAHERYEHSLRTAAYIQHVTKHGTPVWLAHREGRAKDGRDTTAPALMRTLSNNGDSELECPACGSGVHQLRMGCCDAFKVNELLHLEKHGAYTKADGEDERSMWTGLVGQKGKVHLQFGDVLPWKASSKKSSLSAPWLLLLTRPFIVACALGPTNGWRRSIWVGPQRRMPMCPNPPRRGRHMGQRKERVETEINALGWSKEQVSRKWCEILAAPLALRQALLDES